MNHRCRRAGRPLTDADAMTWLRKEVESGRVQLATARLIWSLL